MKEITRKDLIKKYIEFFKKKDHKEIKNSSLIPENDPTVLFTTAGMHPLVQFLSGEKHPQGKRLVNVQRCIRTGDIEEVGDTTHHTFFEMLGNWSLGDYFKKEAIEMSFEFLTKTLKIPIERLAVSVFTGNKNSPKDTEAAKIWKKLEIPESRIAFLGKEDNWWGPAGNTGPCGPDTEMFYWKSNDKPAPKKFDPKNKNWVEIWNDVLMQYNKDKNKNYNEAKQKNIDTGMGVERTIAILEGLEDNYLTDCWNPIIEKIEKLSNRRYGQAEGVTKDMRIIADHIKAAVFIIADGVVPSNTEQGYVLKRLIRRAMRYGMSIDLKDFVIEVAKPVFNMYDDYSKLKQEKITILGVLKQEEEKFNKTIQKGLRIFDKKIMEAIEKKRKSLKGKRYIGLEKKDLGEISGKEAFLLYQSHGFPLELIIEEAKKRRGGLKVDIKGFQKEMESHQQLSRTSSSQKFKSGLADNSQATKKLHTATHLLNESLRVVLKNNNIQQKGSNITPDRLRFDFNFDRKLTPDEIKKIEDLVNLKIKENLLITCQTMPMKKAKELGAQGVFEDKYDSEVNVYSIGPLEKEFSKEICAGPHVNNTSELGHFKIIKEESSSSGVRRIKAILE